MSEEFIPSLTLNPTATATEAMVEEPVVEEEVVEEVPEKKDDYGLSALSDAEQAAVIEFSKTIDIGNTEQVITYGSAAQKNIADFSEATLNSVKTKDMGEVGSMLSNLVVELKGLNFDEEEKKGLKGLFKNSKKSLAELKTQYDKAEVNVDKIVEELEKHEVVLMKDIRLMDKMYDKNLAYLKELSMYIIAGKLKLQDLKENELPLYQKKAAESGLPEDAQAASDYANMLERFEKKVHDLELTRMVSVQMAPQIRLIQNNDQLMNERIRSSITNSIPLWKNQMVLALAMHHSDAAMKAQHEVNEVTNELLKKNAATLHSGTVSIAREAERSIIDLDTLKQTNQELISTLDEVRKIQDDGRAKRAAAQEELEKIEDELKKKLLDIKG